MRSTAATLAALLLLSLAAPARAAHPHYLRLLRQGTFALEQGEAAAAVRDLRLACFGFLEEPPLLGECLVRLGLSQAAAGDDEGFGATFRRVVEVEQRFGGFGAAALSAEERAAFEAAIVERIPPRTLGYSDVFRHLVPREPSRPDGKEKEEREEKETPREPGGTEHSEEAPPEAVEAPPKTRSQLSRQDRSTLERARVLVERAGQRSDLEEPYRLARRVADANPASREAQHLAAVIAYRSSRWNDAVRYFRRGGDPGDGNPETLFYLAVAQYESGDLAGARDTLRRSLPRLEQTPFVRRYQEKILGTGALSTERPRVDAGGASRHGSEQRGSSLAAALR